MVDVLESLTHSDGMGEDAVRFALALKLPPKISKNQKKKHYTLTGLFPVMMGEINTSFQGMDLYILLIVLDLWVCGKLE